MEYLPLDECEKGVTYRLHSRNLAVGVYDGGTGFIGIREKFGDRFLDAEYYEHTAYPLQRLERCPVTDLRMWLRDQCKKCGEPVKFVPREPPKRYPVDWFHEVESDCPDAHPSSPENKVLFDWLDERQDEWLQED